MENEEKIVELLAESLKRFDQMVAGQQETNWRLGNLEMRADKNEKQLQLVDKNLTTLNLQTVDNARPIFKLADNVRAIADLHNRVTKLEKTVYK